MRLLLTFCVVVCASCAKPSSGTGGVETDAGGDGPGDCASGQTSFEAAVIDFSTGQPPTQITSMTQPSSNTRVTAAPNGRVVACLQTTSLFELVFAANGYLVRRLVVSAATLQAALAENAPLTVALATTETIDGIAQSVGITRDPGTAVVWIDMRRYPGGTGTLGAIVNLPTLSLGPFVQNAQGTFVSSPDTTDNGISLFLNTETSSGATRPMVVAPTGCESPPSLPLAGDTLTSWLATCP